MFEFKKVDITSRSVRYYWYGPFLLRISKMDNVWYGILKFEKEVVTKFHPESFDANEANVKRYLERNMLEKAREIMEGLFSV